MAPNKYHPILACFILIVFISIMYFLCSRFSAQIFVLKAKSLIKENNYQGAIALLKRAQRQQTNDPIIYKTMGHAYSLIANENTIFESFEPAKSARGSYMQGNRLNPLDFTIALGLAKAEERIEYLYPLVHSVKNPYNAQPFYERLIRLNPNMVEPLKVFIRYLHWKKEPQLLQQTVKNLTRMDPEQYRELKKQTLWSPEVKRAVKAGVRQAIAQKINLSGAHAVMMDMLKEEKDWSGAIHHLQKHRFYRKKTHPEPKDDIRYYLILGRLFLENGQAEMASESFIKAIGFSTSAEKAIETVYHTYKNKESLEQLEQFYIKLRKYPTLTDMAEKLFVSTLFDLKKYNQAKRVLEEKAKQKPDVWIYFWIAKIAERENDLTAAERAIKKASLSEPTNSQLYTFHSRILSKQKKFSEAEQKIDLALRFSMNPHATLYHHRALIRLNRNNQKGAAEDWESAIRINPNNQQYLILAADAHQRLGNTNQSIKYIEKAVILDPENKIYRKRLDAAKKGVK